MADDLTKRRMLKELIRQLHAGAQPQEVKERFKQVLEDVNPLEIAKIEEDLIKEGMPREEVQRLCEVHLAVFKEQLKGPKEGSAPENPINILKEEHKILLQLAEKLITIVSRIHETVDKGVLGEEMTRLKSVIEDLLDAENHYLREENVLFPVLEKHGIKEPPAIMWMEHNQIREKKKNLRDLVEKYGSMSPTDFSRRLSETAKSLESLISSHLFKEDNILFPAALNVVTDDEWREIRREFDDIGYCRFTPKHLIAKMETKETKPATVPEGILQFETGMLSKEEAEAVLHTLPVDVTFVDKNDTVKYFNKSEIFVRTKAVIGRKVQLCHPKKSVDIVNRILEAFKSGEQDVADFWIPMKGRLIYIRYFAVRDKDGRYLGTMEVTQDITNIKKIEGERRLLDWKE